MSEALTAFQEDAFQNDAFQIFIDLGFAAISITEVIPNYANISLDETRVFVNANVNIIEISS